MRSGLWDRFRVLGTTLVVGLLILLGLVGIVLPLLPGSLLIFTAVLAWAVVLGSSTGWWILAVVAVLLLLGGVAKYALPGRHLRARGIPTRTLVIGGLGAIVGFFVVPVVGLVLGFVLGVYLVELRRLGPERAWTSTRHTVRAVGLSILIELAAGLLAAVTWAVGAALAL